MSHRQYQPNAKDRARRLRRSPAWDFYFVRFEAFSCLHGHANVPRHWPDDPDLGRWVAQQREMNHHRKLHPERFRLLDEQGFLWLTSDTRVDERWNKSYDEMCAWQRKHGHTRVTKREDNRLSHWRHFQRVQYRQGLLSSERIARLDAIGFEWAEPDIPGIKFLAARTALQRDYDAVWETRFKELIEFQREHGHTLVPHFWPPNPALGHWVGSQRHRFARQRLLPQRQERLEALGFIWRTSPEESSKKLPGEKKQRYLAERTERWQQRYEELCAWREQHGNTRVSKLQNKSLSHWRHYQRELQRLGQLPSDRVAALDAIGFEWFASNRSRQHKTPWDQRLAQLADFHRRHGHANIPARWPENQQFGLWLSKQRELHRSGRLPPGRQHQLESLGVEWEHLHNRQDELWERHFQRLCDYHKQRGHTRVSTREDAGLAGWRHYQITLRRQGRLRTDRIMRLHAMGFEFDPPPHHQR